MIVSQQITAAATELTQKVANAPDARQQIEKALTDWYVRGRDAFRNELTQGSAPVNPLA